MVGTRSTDNSGAPQPHERAAGKRAITPTSKAHNPSPTAYELKASGANKRRDVMGPSGRDELERGKSADESDRLGDGAGAAGGESESEEGEDNEGSSAESDEPGEGAPSSSPTSLNPALDGARNKHTTPQESRIIINLAYGLRIWRKSGVPGGRIVSLVAGIVGKAINTVQKVLEEWTSIGTLYDGSFFSAGGRKKGWRKQKALETPAMDAFIRERIEASNRPTGAKEQAHGITFRKLHHLVCVKFGLLSARPAVPSPRYLPIQTFIDHVHRLGARKCKGGRFNPLKFAPSTQLRVDFFLRRYHMLVVEPTAKYALDPTSPMPPIQIFFDEAAFSENSNSDFSIFFGADKFLKRKHSKGQRLMIEHCMVFVQGCYFPDGKPQCYLLPGAQLSITDKGIIAEEHYKNTSVKCEGTLNSKLFDIWAENTAQLIRAKFPTATIVAIFDNAGVHSVNVAECWEYDKCPSGARVEQLRTWLKKEIDLPFNDVPAQTASLANPAERHMWNTWHWWTKATRDELMEYAVVVRGGPIYRLDEAFKKHNITTCRTPPYYPEWQPIEFVWGYVKNYVYVTSEYAGIFSTLQATINEAYAKLAKEDGQVLLAYREHCHGRILEAYAQLPPRAPGTGPTPPAGPSIMEPDDELASDDDVSDDDVSE